MQQNLSSQQPGPSPKDSTLTCSGSGASFSTVKKAKKQSTLYSRPLADEKPSNGANVVLVEQSNIKTFSRKSRPLKPPQKSRILPDEAKETESASASDTLEPGSAVELQESALPEAQNTFKENIQKFARKEKPSKKNEECIPIARWNQRVGGVQVQFPHVPYVSQFALMDRIIRAFDRKENALLESPTGTGKTLAILCSALAWKESKREEYLKAQEEFAAKYGFKWLSGAATDDNLPSELLPDFGRNEKRDNTEQTIDKDTIMKRIVNKANQFSQDPEFEEDPHFKMKFNTSESVVGNDHIDSIVNSTIDITTKKLISESNQISIEPAKKGCPISTEDINKMEKLQQAVQSKIFVASRTHKQISQIIKELKSTVYRPKMTLLGSRQHYCINPGFKNSTSKDNDCLDLLEYGTCSFYKREKIIVLSARMAHTKWDIEDLKDIGIKHHACPYFTARNMTAAADIIFTPYNYLIDPQIRSAMMIDLENSMVIIDEAHNIEDSCRQAATIDITLSDLIAIKEDFEKVLSEQQNPKRKLKYETVCISEHENLKVISSSLVNALASVHDFPIDQFDRKLKIMSGTEMIDFLAAFNITPTTVANFEGWIKSIFNAVGEARGSNRELICATKRSLRLLETLSYASRMVLEPKSITDFRVVVSQDSLYSQKEIKKTLSFWCLSPHIIFQPLSRTVNSVVLTSGTLSPMISFASELGTEFQHKFEGGHVIQKSQVWVGVITHGSSSQEFLGTYQISESFAYQDQIAQTILDAIKIIPHGVLCFFPSYSFMDKMISRMKAKGIWNEICEYKKIIQEPKNASASDFEGTISEFYDQIKLSTSCTSNVGSLFFAVYRGKVSEGLDFVDDNARGVIAIGIPYPNIKDLQVGVKKSYNDQFSSSRKLVNGSEWYDIQAFRAVNQALGRCIRHQNDWGAILLLDCRYSRPKPLSYISKWVRQNVQIYNRYEDSMSSLSSFIDNRIKNCHNKEQG